MYDFRVVFKIYALTLDQRVVSSAGSGQMVHDPNIPELAGGQEEVTSVAARDPDL